MRHDSAQTLFQAKEHLLPHGDQMAFPAPIGISIITVHAICNSLFYLANRAQPVMLIHLMHNWGPNRT
jgi:hypothetical protein